MKKWPGLFHIVGAPFLYLFLGVFWVLFGHEDTKKLKEGIRK